MQFESQYIDTFNPNSDASGKNYNSYKYGLLEDKKSSFLWRNSQSLNLQQSDINPMQAYNTADRDSNYTIQQRLKLENEMLLNEFAKTYIFLQGKNIDFISPCQENLRTNVQYIVENDCKYIGEVNEYKQRHGKGIIIKKDKSYYFGDFQNDQKNGLGIQVHSNQERYEGEYVNDTQIGKGKLFYINGDQYIGQIENGMKHGQGKAIFYDLCATFIGKFRCDKREGQGLLISFNGKVIQEGIYKDDQLVSSCSNIPTFKSLKSQNSKQNTKSRVTFEGIDVEADLKQQMPIDKIETNVQLYNNENKITSELSDLTNQQNFKMSIENNEIQNSSCYCSLLPQSIRDFLRI
ncbi:MORN motif protein (macronuclear) [Tetrahymena thermophila SB210]|uniref:MORN motif protein n=1 Tax=Tetrahymena thermophila (strain SB210) TaxID=312017 RepID=I7MHN2_TETTS|nr:MORN motif protein [Tetrahymena thermophila SB210]EAS03129.1 MORN motif protein [Tetrahymena thermophila SB210]|eukprot:XP_001023374.1 MORN motif protein [Tetrahymena thermophila SB210]